MQNEIIMLSIKMSYGGVNDTIHPVLLKGKQGHLLVDCGFIGALPAIEAELDAKCIRPEEIGGILLTHHDHDHMGAAAAFKEKYPSIKIYASKEEAPYISAEKKPLRLAQAEALQQTLPPEQQEFGRGFCDLLRRVLRVPVDVFLQEGDILDFCGGCEVIATPGHTLGHIALFIKSSATIVAGDAFVLEDGKPVIANLKFALDAGQALASIDKLLRRGAKTILCYHSGEYRP